MPGEGPRLARGAEVFLPPPILAADDYDPPVVLVGIEHEPQLIAGLLAPSYPPGRFAIPPNLYIIVLIGPKLPVPAPPQDDGSTAPRVGLAIGWAL